jgi:protoporphyrinogen oxidase
MTRTAVIGAGMVGLTTAYRLAGRGEDVEVFERDSVPGGLAASFEPAPGGDRLERFYHHVFRSDRHFMGLARELGLQDDVHWSAPGASCFYDGRLHALDSPRSLLTFAPLKLFQRLRLAMALGILKASPSGRPFESVRSAGWLRRVGGKRAYSVVFDPLFRSKFGRYAEDISLTWFWARIHDRTESLGYPRGGFVTIYERLVQRIRERGGHVRFNARVAAVEPDGKALRVRHGGQGGEAAERFDRVVGTIPLPAFAGVAPAMPNHFYERYAPAPGLAARCVILALDRPLTGVYWINVCEPGAPFTVVVEQTALVDPARYGGKHLVYLGNYGPSFPDVSAASLVELFTPYLQRLNPAFSQTWVRDAWQFVARDAQPIVTPGYAARIAPHRTPVSGIFVANIYQVYPHDRGQNYAVHLADSVIRSMDAAS